ncbi:malonate decarboxylase holo-ACP synthase [Paraburkholderia silvatlantica]|nr:malonate decarboxylase holo-ACP synthase [Paraburkholderia silvatlantica]PVY32226.1 phosphoribosyl-dephospho-CoA transferase [Paraburkholderia silvatlantica]PXW37846.1 phosphoribosyl-dephospho-CoA transferase [Paraburkholderia silvatlantica]PYE25667.1 phosphoribosyl-dephospho-CoA transferase [Paraburkholderia silvatlantica]TDQ97690.1 phosphoribosyl-dephospho-CoA transferase [Paraburkholderia silvatlantica]
MHVCAALPFAVDAPRVDDARWRAHDLLRIAHHTPSGDEPDWVRAALARAPWVVVRRTRAAAGFVAVGVRGSVRPERFGTWLHTEDIESSFAPEDLPGVEPLRTRRALPAFIALAALRTSAAPLRNYVWGPTGSAGFELATGVPTLTASSDLDILIRLPQRVSRAAIDALAQTLAQAASRCGTRIDAQLETPAGGVALAELAAHKPRVLARASSGAQLVADPWQAA